MSDELTVYLDHLIDRESLRYVRSNVDMSAPVEQGERLRLRDLQDRSRYKYLRKPDFQRETWAWTPEDCVSLLDSMVTSQVIPSVILWTSPDNQLEFVLDGGHRISVILAWFRDDWGDNPHVLMHCEQEQQSRIKQAAERVRDLLRGRVGTIDEYRDAEQEMERIVDAGKAPKDVMSDVRFRRATFYARLLKGQVSLHVLWATGDYEKAEQSFLKINKSGRQLSDWETKLVDNRNSSFARTVMSVASISSAPRYWPTDVEGMEPALAAQKVESIVKGIERISETLFHPSYQTNISSLGLPLLVTSGSQQRPYYLAEFLTVIRGGKGQPAETERLLAEGRADSPREIVENGYQLVGDTIDVLDHLVGHQSKSLSIVPALYFYTESGRYVRSLLYGFVYWLISGSEQDCLNRKRAFSVHRSSFEEILLTKKEEIVTGLTRRIGSGPEITMQTASYFNGLLELLDKHSGRIDTDGFRKGYSDLSREITSLRPRALQMSEGRTRAFTERQRSQIVLQALLRNAAHCEICGGLLDPAFGVQIDHVVEYAKGGHTAPGNGRIAHPFCNNQRDEIEAARAGHDRIAVPSFSKPALETTATQLRLSLFDDEGFNR